MATEKQKVLGLDSVEQIKTYVCFACENTKRDVKVIMDREHDEMKEELKDYTSEEISKRAVLVDSEGDISNYTVKSIKDNEALDDSLDPNASWELKKAGNGQLSNTHIGWETDGSGYIGQKNKSYNFEGAPINSYDKTIHWDQDGIIKFGKDVRPWEGDIKATRQYAYELFQELLRLIGELKDVIPSETVYIKLDNINTKLDIHKIK